MKFGSLLRATRIKAEVSALALASEVGVTETTMCRWERSEWLPGEAKTVLRLAAFLSADPLDLVVAWARERSGFVLPALGDDRDRAAAVLMLCWGSVPETGAVTVTLEPTEPALRLVRQ